MRAQAKAWAAAAGLTGVIAAAHLIATRLPALWAPHVVVHLSWSAAAAALAVVTWRGRARMPANASRVARTGAWLVFGGLAWVSVAQAGEAAAARLETPDVGPLHTATSIAALGAVPAILAGGNAWAWGATPRGSPLRWAIIGALLLLVAAVLLTMVGVSSGTGS